MPGLGASLKLHIYVCLYMCIYMFGYMCALAHLWRPEHHLWESVVSLHHGQQVSTHQAILPAQEVTL